MQTSIARDKGIMKTERINYDLLFMSAAYINHKFVAGELTNEVVKRGPCSRQGVRVWRQNAWCYIQPWNCNAMWSRLLLTQLQSNEYKTRPFNVCRGIALVCPYCWCFASRISSTICKVIMSSTMPSLSWKNRQFKGLCPICLYSDWVSILTALQLTLKSANIPIRIVKVVVERKPRNSNAFLRRWSGFVLISTLWNLFARAYKNILYKRWAWFDFQEFRTLG